MVSTVTREAGKCGEMRDNTGKYKQKCTENTRKRHFSVLVLLSSTKNIIMITCALNSGVKMSKICQKRKNRRKMSENITYTFTICRKILKRGICGV